MSKRQQSSLFVQSDNEGSETPPQAPSKRRRNPNRGSAPAVTRTIDTIESQTPSLIQGAPAPPHVAHGLRTQHQDIVDEEAASAEEIQEVREVLDLTQIRLRHSGILADEDDPWPAIRQRYSRNLHRVATLVPKCCHLRRDLDDAHNLVKDIARESTENWMLDRDEHTFSKLFGRAKKLLQKEHDIATNCGKLLERSEYRKIFKQRILDSTGSRLLTVEECIDFAKKLIQDLEESKKTRYL